MTTPSYALIRVDNHSGESPSKMISQYLSNFLLYQLITSTLDLCGCLKFKHKFLACSLGHKYSANYTHIRVASKSPTLLGSSGSALVPHKEGVRSESFEWNKLALGELYPWFGQTLLESDKLGFNELWWYPKKNSIKIKSKN